MASGILPLDPESNRRLKFPALIDPKPSRQRNLVLAIIVQRLLHPASNLVTTRL